MRTVFFDELGETLTKTAREFGVRAESLYETQKLRTKISGEERTINKLMADLGKTIYRAYAKGGDLTDEQKELCEKIAQHKEMIERCKAEMAGKKGKKICPSCKEAVDKAVAFCPYCGAACPTTEPEEAAGDVAEESAAEEAASEETAEETASETEAPGFPDEPVQKETEPEETVAMETEAGE